MNDYNIINSQLIQFKQSTVYTELDNNNNIQSMHEQSPKWKNKQQLNIIQQNVYNIGTPDIQEQVIRQTHTPKYLQLQALSLDILHQLQQQICMKHTHRLQLMHRIEHTSDQYYQLLSAQLQQLYTHLEQNNQQYTTLDAQHQALTSKLAQLETIYQQYQLEQQHIQQEGAILQAHLKQEKILYNSRMQIGASHQQELQACSSAYKQNVSKYNYLVHKLRNVDIQLSQCITNSNRSNMGGAGGSNHKNSVTCKDSVRRSASKGRDSQRRQIRQNIPKQDRNKNISHYGNTLSTLTSCQVNRSSNQAHKHISNNYGCGSVGRSRHSQKDTSTHMDTSRQLQQCATINQFNL